LGNFILAEKSQNKPRFPLYLFLQSHPELVSGPVHSKQNSVKIKFWLAKKGCRCNRYREITD
jgi:hypothetical protein